MAEVAGTLVREQSGMALFMHIQVPGSGKESVFAVLTTLPLTTLRPEVTKVRAATLFPKQCLETAAQASAVPMTSSVIVRESFATLDGSAPMTPSDIELSNSRCDLHFRVNLDPLKITLLSFKALR